LCKFYDTGKNQDSLDKFFIINLHEGFNKRVQKYNNYHVTKISSYEENIGQFCGDQNFYKKENNGKKKIFQAKFKFHAVFKFWLKPSMVDFLCGLKPAPIDK
jgi:hypothetical protein